MKIEEFVWLGLATWRLASLLVNEKGPFDMFVRIRAGVGIVEMRLDDKPEVYTAVPDTFLGKLFDCVWCCSLWIGLALTVLYFFAPVITMWGTFPLALSALAILLEVWIRNR